MGFSPTVLLCFSLLCFSCLMAADDNLTAYEVLQSYDFPVGLLPKGVSGYELDKSTGKFSVYLNETCTFSLEKSYDLKYKSAIKGYVAEDKLSKSSYELRYKSTIKGYIAKDKLSKLEGISVKVLFFWINIIKVTRSDDKLDFSVGIISADFSIENFYESPQCGCGFDCDDAQVTRIRTDSSFVSSS